MFANTVSTLADYHARSTEGLSGFRGIRPRSGTREKQITDKDGVTRITFHAAKGLEFPMSFCIGL